MRRKIFTSICLTALLSVLGASIAICALMYRELYNNMIREIETEAVYLAKGVEGEGISYLERLQGTESVDRLTWIDENGTVLYENMAEASAMDNHSGRPEVKAAIENGYGRDARESDTIGTQIFYYAIRLSDGSVFRVAKATESVWGILQTYVPYTIGICLLMIAVAMVVAKGLARKIVVPINNLNLEDPLSQEVYEELSPLMIRIARQNASIESGIHTLKAQQEEFAAITENMNEGLIVLDGNGTILTLNQTAKKVFGVKDQTEIHHNILMINRSNVIQRAVNSALSGKSEEGILNLDGRQYEIFSNPVIVSDIIKGAILLIHDVTEKQESERMRREFTANVSHELKTPLQSISGYAELLKSGMVRPEDVQGFSERIYKETSRLIRLVADIIQLSHLDEATGQAEKEPVQLKKLAQEIAAQFHEKAMRMGVEIQVSGTEGEVFGVRSILDEMIYNLCDNAVKYNRTGGSVKILIEEKNHKVILSVKDTGIGIPLESQARVFERFYRVDKSRSKSTGGTGLGLSIVKHGAIFHKAEIELESKLGEGTCIIIFFPKQEI